MNELICNVSVLNIDNFLKTHEVLVCMLRNSRIKAKRIAILEVLSALYTENAVFIPNSPLGDVKGIFSVFIPKEKLKTAFSKLENIGYCNKFYLLDFSNPSISNESDIVSINELVWKKRRFSVKNLFIQDEQIYINQSAHNRVFYIYGNENEVKEVKGYRGDGSDYGRRALPVEDCRCLVNLAIPSVLYKMVDPFAGAGGIIYIARKISENMRTFSIDIDEKLEPGLKFYSIKHYCADSSAVDLGDEVFNALVTEIPFSKDAVGNVIKAFVNIGKNLSDEARVVIMCGDGEDDILCSELNKNGIHIYFTHKLNRKGTDVSIIAGTKSISLYKQFNALCQALEKIY